MNNVTRKSLENYRRMLARHVLEPVGRVRPGAGLLPQGAGAGANGIDADALYPGGDRPTGRLDAGAERLGQRAMGFLVWLGYSLGGPCGAACGFFAGTLLLGSFGKR